MPTELKPLQEFFNKRVFRIPDYQRGFAWNQSQLEDFWQDLKRIPEGRSHYTGQLTLEAVPQDAWQNWDEDIWLITGRNYKPFYVVDGQQRLTTAVILLKCLLDRVPEGEGLAFTPKEEITSTFLFCKPERVKHIFSATKRTTRATTTLKHRFWVKRTTLTMEQKRSILPIYVLRATSSELD